MKIICIGSNYSEHAKELDNEVPTEPVFFMKPDSSLLVNNKPFFYPGFSNEIHHEVELVVKINRLGKNISPKFAHRYYNEIGIGIDFTARDLQNECKKNGKPWEIAKAFDNSAPVSKFLSLDKLHPVDEINFHLTINGNIVQKGFSGDMIFPVDQLISYISRYQTLKIGDLLFTGTPSGVGPVKIGDKLEAFIEGIKMMEFYIK